MIRRTDPMIPVKKAFYRSTFEGTGLICRLWGQPSKVNKGLKKPPACECRRLLFRTQRCMALLRPPKVLPDLDAVGGSHVEFVARHDTEEVIPVIDKTHDTVHAIVVG